MKKKKYIWIIFGLLLVATFNIPNNKNIIKNIYNSIFLSFDGDVMQKSMLIAQGTIQTQENAIGLQQISEEQTAYQDTGFLVNSDITIIKPDTPALSDKNKVLKINDILQYRINFINSDRKLKNDLNIQATIPTNSELIPDSMDITRSSSEDVPVLDLSGDSIGTNIKEFTSRETITFTYRVKVIADSGTVEQKATILNRTLPLAESEKLINMILPSEMSMPKGPYCFSKQFLTKTIDAVRPMAENITYEENLKTILGNFGDAVEYYLQNRSDDKVYESFKKLVLSSPCVQTTENYIYGTGLEYLKEMGATPDSVENITSPVQQVNNVQSNPIQELPIEPAPTDEQEQSQPLSEPALEQPNPQDIIQLLPTPEPEPAPAAEPLPIT